TRPRARRRLGDLAEEQRLVLERAAELALQLAVDLADAALGDAEDLADLAQREVLDVEQHRDLPLAPRQRLEGGAEALLRRRLLGAELRVEALVRGGDRVDALDRRLVVGERDRVERGHVRAGDVGLPLAQLLDADADGVGELLLARPAPVDGGELGTGAGDVALPAAERARRPVLAAELVEHRAVDAGPDELLQRRALVRVVAVDGVDETLDPARDEVLE